MFDFVSFAPTKVVFGRGAEEKVAELLKEQGAKKALLHFGGESARKSGLLAKIEAILRAGGIDFVSLGGVVPNPRLSKVREGIALCQKEKVDFILAVGGGSVIDSAKAIAYGVAESEFDVWEIYEKKRVPKKSLPVGCVLTIAASGSEMSDSSVITRDETGEKRGANSNLCRLKFAVMNPCLTETLPDWQTQSGCTDIIMHTLERYFTQGGNLEITDAIAKAVIQTVMKHSLILKTDPKNYESRAEVMWAGSLSHNGLTGCGAKGMDFASHRLEHELGGMFDVTHGAGLAAIWGTWAKYVFKDCLPRFAKFARDIMKIENSGSDENDALLGIEKMVSFFKKIGMPTSIRELGISPTESQIVEMAKSCERAVGGQIGTAKVLRFDDFVKIYRMAM